MQTQKEDVWLCDTKLFLIKVYKHAHFGVWTFPVAHTVKNLVGDLGSKDPLEKGIATHFSILA